MDFLKTYILRSLLRAKALSIVAYIFIMCALNACGVKKSQGGFRKDEGYLYYHQSNPELGFRVFGDYFVHSLDPKYFNDVSRSFLKYSLGKIKTTKPRLVFAAHTTVHPYYSCISTLYGNTTLDSSLVDVLRNEMRSSLGIKNDSYAVIYTNYGSAIKFEYQVLHPITKIRSAHLEYLINHSGSIIRFCFWTIESNNDLVFSEAEGIIKNLEF